MGGLVVQEQHLGVVVQEEQEQMLQKKKKGRFLNWVMTKVIQVQIEKHILLNRKKCLHCDV